ncbi:BREX-1 system adenine-specific DNA-methyltransferase PglX [bacterium]|nr:BREX-1 system adenine-specific DNA-methyltransferase PglX [bacterium]
MALFQKSVLNQYLKQQDCVAVEKAYKKFVKYFFNPITQQNIRDINEEGFQQKFLMELFVTCFGYVINPDPDYNLTTEFKNLKDAKKADGAILVEGRATAVIELKGTNTKNLEKCRQQAFDYKSNHPTCIYVITSNFEKLRFYINTSDEFEEFDLFTLNQERFELLYLCLAKDNLLSNIPLQIKEASVQQEEAITKKFYKDYSTFKRELFRDLVKLNMKNNVFRNELNIEDRDRANKNIKQNLFKKSQKLIDRFLFIFFAEDRGLLPPNSTVQILEQWNRLKDDDAYFPLYHRYKLYFNYLDQGRAGTDKKAEIFAYNGGLFKPDAVLDSLIISDELLAKHTSALQAYDFESQVDVNILGHIFENSLNEIESVNAEIEGTDFAKQTTKRKKDGVFYTPKYITKYIVDNTVGKLCNEKKDELGVVEEEYLKSRKGRSKTKLKELLDSLETYREWLLHIAILDPACGSGAFLNQALDFLIKEHQNIDGLQTSLLGGGFVFPDIENTVLENNIFGVDLNEESVEIAKLSLWLRTAQPRRKLNDLSSNIKCGNSLIDCKTIAGDKAFNWQNEFPQTFQKGGFDVVIGNPPYGAKISKNDIEFISNRFNNLISGEIDTYIAFYFESIRLLKDDGILGYITPDTWLTISRAEGLRKYLSENVQIHDLHDWYKPFKDAKDTRCHTIVFSKTQNSKYNFNVVVVDSKGNPIKLFSQRSNLLESFNSWNLYTSPLEQKMFNKMDVSSRKMEELYNLKYGLRTGNNNKYLTSDISNSEKEVKIARGSNIENYYFKWDPEYLITQEGLPSSYFEENVLNNPKIIIQYVRTNSTAIDSRWLEAALIDEPNFVPLNSTSFIYPTSDAFQLKYLLCLLSSKLMNFYYKGHYTDVNVKPLYLSKLPIVNANQKTQDDFIEKAELMLCKNKDFYNSRHFFNSYLTSKFSFKKLSAKLKNYYQLEFGDFIKELNKAIKTIGREKLTKMDEMEWMEVFETKKLEAQTIKAQIDKTDKEIDAMVYELYDLTDEEIAIVEAN